jgi:hypothetical protein
MCQDVHGVLGTGDALSRIIVGAVDAVVLPRDVPHQVTEARNFSELPFTALSRALAKDSQATRGWVTSVVRGGPLAAPARFAVSR